MFEKIAHGISEIFSDVMPHTFCIGCFLQGLVEGAVLAVATVAVIALLPAELAIVATVGLAALGVYGMAQLAENWGGMSDGAKSKALGNITGAVVGGFAGAKMVAPVEAPPGVQLLKGPEGEVVPVIAGEDGGVAATTPVGQEVGMSEGVAGEVAPADAGTRVVKDAYLQHPKISEENVGSYVQGTDFSRPVVSKTLNPGEQFDMLVRDGGRPGIHATYPGTDPGTLGINLDEVPRHLETFQVTRPLPVVESTVAKFPEGEVSGVGGTGGGKQLILPPNWQDSVTPVQK